MADTAVTISRARTSQLSLQEQARGFSHKYTVKAADVAFGAGSTDTVTLTLGALPAKWAINNALVNVSTAFALVTLSENVGAVAVDDLKSGCTRCNVAAIRAWVTQTLWVINRIHTQLKLRLVGVPATWANQELIVLGLDDLALELLQLEASVATITLRNRILTGGKPVSHYIAPPMYC